MSKTLHFLRHAKSSWDSGALSDIQRPLNERGLESCKVMAPAMVKAGCSFSHIFCSPAVRAQSTIELISSHLPEQNIKWVTDEELYTFSERALLKICQELSDELDEAMIVGHNPAITELTNDLSGELIANISTCGYVQLACDVSSWSELGVDTAQLVCYLKPKMFI